MWPAPMRCNVSGLRINVGSSRLHTPGVSKWGAPPNLFLRGLAVPSGLPWRDDPHSVL